MPRQDRSVNHLLRRLPAKDYVQLAPDLEAVSLSFKERLYALDKQISHVYFVTAGVASLVTTLDGGDEIIETGTIGREGMVGLPAFLGMQVPIDTAFIQVPGSALRVELKRFLATTAKSEALHDLLLRYTYTVMMMTAQTAACNRAHVLEARMARWLLMTHDRVDSDEFSLTQEFIGQMLGVRRPAVSVAGGTLQKAGLIQYTRGRITIVDRRGLEKASCECYARVRKEHARVFGEQFLMRDPVA